jgi:hypothetical protein
VSSITRPNLYQLFAYACCLAMTLPLLFPFYHLVYFAPFIILCFYRSSKINALQWSLACGLFVDLFSADTRIGTYAINYVAVSFFLYRYQFHFFEDRFSTLPLMTFIFTALSMILQTVIFFISGKVFSLSWEWFISDLLAIPLQTALYAWVAFILPQSLFISLKRRYYLRRP